MITLADIEQARERIRHFVRRTPLVRKQTLSDRLGTNAYLKLEVLQKTGAFKVRGAFNRMLTLSDEERRRGVVAVSGGNHAQAVAYAARVLGLNALVIMPETTPRNYVDATIGYGAEIVFTTTIAAAYDAVAAYASIGRVYVHPFGDPLVIAGQGTIGLELIEDLPQLTDVIVSIGGGGLAGGIATAVKALKPEVSVWGVETEGADSMSRAIAAGEVVRLPAITSVVRTLGAPEVTKETLALARQYLEGVTVVSDAEAIDSLRYLLERAKVLTEPAASCTLAAADRLSANFDADHHVALILCGGNLALDDLHAFGIG